MSENLKTALSSALSLPVPTEGEVLTPIKVSSNTPENLSEDIKKDYKLARKKYRKVLDVGEQALSELHEIAKATEHPRSYEVLATMMRAVSETTSDLYAIHEKTQKLAGPVGTSKSGNIEIEKAVFVGSPSEMLDKLKKNAN